RGNAQEASGGLLRVVDSPHAYRRHLEMRLLGDGIPLGDRELVRRARATVRRPERSVMERREDNPFGDVEKSRPGLHRAASRLHAYEIAFGDAVSVGVGGRHLDPRVGSGGFELPCTPRLGPGMEVVDGSSRRKTQWEFVRG